MVDHAILALGAAEEHHLFDDLWHRIGFRSDRASARAASERAHAAHHALRLLAGQQRDFLLHRDQRAAAHHHLALLGEIHGHDRNVFHVDVLPDVQLGPVGKRKNADALALVYTAIEKVPQLWALVLRILLAEG